MVDGQLRQRVAPVLDDDDALVGDLGADPMQAVGDGGQGEEAVQLGAGADGFCQGDL